MDRGRGRWMRWTLAGLLSVPLPLAGAPAAADPICRRDATPLLRLTARFSAYEANQASTQVLVVYQSGQALTAGTTWRLTSGVPGDAEVAEGPLAAEDFARVLDELSAARIGVAKDCNWYPGCCGIGATLRVTWYGRAGRVHTFVAMEEPTLPRCSPQIDSLLQDALVLTIAPPIPTTNR